MRRVVDLSIVFAVVTGLLWPFLEPPHAWAIRAPDGRYAPLPDYDIRKGYSLAVNLKDPRIAQEIPILRQQQAAKKARTAGVSRTAAPVVNEEELITTFGQRALVEWDRSGVIRHLSSDEGPLAPAQPGLEPGVVARQFLRNHQRLFGLSDAVINALGRVQQERSPGDGEDIIFRQTVAGVPVYDAELKVSLSRDNSVLAVGGTLFPGLTVSQRWSLSVIEATKASARYVGPVGLQGKYRKGLGPTPQSPPTSVSPDWMKWGRVEAEPGGEFAPVVIDSEAGPEERTTLSRGPFRQEVRASRVVFPLSATQGSPAWVVYLMVAPTEYYEIVVDAEDGALLSRVNQVKFFEPQGMTFLTNPDAGEHALSSFVGDSKASPKTFVTATQSATQGNNVVMGIGGNDTSGPRHFELPFTDGYESGGGALNAFDLNGVTLQFTPNPSGGYDLTLPAFSDAPPGDSLGLADDSAACGPPPKGFTFFGTKPAVVCVNSNGNVTLGGSIAVADFNRFEDQVSLALGPGRIMGLWDDLDPEAGGFVGVTPTSNTLCFRWNEVPQFGIADSNTFSICLFGAGSGLPAGTIQISYFSVAATDGMVGIKPPGRTTAGFSDFSSPVSTIGRAGLARVFPDHDDAAAAAVNAFGILNEVGHDRQYDFGFKEGSRNMQTNNFGRGGLQGDPIVAASGFVTDSPVLSSFSNALFATVPDGVCCPFTAFGLFTAADGFRNADSAFDSDVIVHEHGHGVSTRLVRKLNTIQSGAMGEGWSDWFALDYADDPVIAEYVTGNSATGIRTVRYDDTSPHQLGNFGNLLGPFTFEDLFESLPLPATVGTIFIPEVHIDGEIWASVLADLRTALLGSGVSPLTVSTLMIKALKSTPANPSMIQARNALLTAGTQMGLDKCAIWTVFAARGFGNNAANNEIPDTAAGDSLSVFQAFDRPSSCGGSFSTGISIHSADFDGASVGDTLADDWSGTGLWHVSTRRRVGTSGGSFYFGSEGSGTYNTGARVLGTLTSPVLDFSGADRPVLEMSLFVKTEESFFPFDILWVRVSTDGGVTFATQRGIFFWDTNDGFRRVRIDLAPLALESNARIQLYFDTVDETFNNFEGVYVDKIDIRNYTEQ